MPDDTDDASDMASDDEDIDSAEPAIPSQTTTPPPAYLPLRPTLLQMQFSHPYLLLLGRLLRPLGAAISRYLSQHLSPLLYPLQLHLVPRRSSQSLSKPQEA